MYLALTQLVAMGLELLLPLGGFMVLYTVKQRGGKAIPTQSQLGPMLGAVSKPFHEILLRLT